MKKLLGVLICLGYVVALALQVYTFLHYLEEALDDQRRQAVNSSRHDQVSVATPPSSSSSSSTTSAATAAASETQGVLQSTGSPILLPRVGGGDKVTHRLPKWWLNKTQSGQIKSRAKAGVTAPNAVTAPSAASISGALSPPAEFLKDVSCHQARGKSVHQPPDPNRIAEQSFVFPKLALSVQFVGMLSNVAAICLSWMVGVRGRAFYLQPLGFTAFLTFVMGFLASLAWSRGLDSDQFDNQWQFWLFASAYAYVALAFLPLLFIYGSLSPTRAPRLRRRRFRMTEADQLRWERVQQRRQQLDDLLEATGGGDVIYSRTEDGNWRVSRWNSDDEGDSQTTTTTRPETNGGTAAANGGHNGQGQVTGHIRHEAEVLMIIGADGPSAATGSDLPQQSTAASPNETDYDQTQPKVTTSLDKTEQGGLLPSVPQSSATGCACVHDDDKGKQKVDGGESEEDTTDERSPLLPVQPSAEQTGGNAGVPFLRYLE